MFVIQQVPSPLSDPIGFLTHPLISPIILVMQIIFLLIIIISSPLISPIIPEMLIMISSSF